MAQTDESFEKSAPHLLKGKKSQISERRAEQHFEALSANTPENKNRLLKGLVIRIDATRCHVIEEETKDWIICSVRSALHKSNTRDNFPVAVGDQVEFSPLGQEEGVIENVFPRSTEFVRPDTYYKHRRQVIASNIDQVIIITSPQDPDFNPGLVNRYLVAAAKWGIHPLLVVNKLDLGGFEKIENEVRSFEQIPVPIHKTSAVTGEGIKGLQKALKDHINLLIGESGVGKSSLINQFAPDAELATNEVSGSTHRGRHTTTSVELVQLPKGGYILDSPGVRSFGLCEVSVQELPFLFPEFSKYIPGCKFNDCTHRMEPGCAVRKAMQDGLLHPSRYENYIQIHRTLEDEEEKQEKNNYIQHQRASSRRRKPAK